jgi:hypothetical protein
MTETFDPVKRRAILNIRSTPATPVATVTSPARMSNLAHLSTILKTVMEAGRLQQPEMPKTPSRTHIASLPALSPLKPTPSKLHRFLKYAEKNLGVQSATVYEFGLQAKGYGPDILHLVPDKDFSEIGVRPGDAIRLKAGCVSWWNGPDAKRKYLDDDTTAVATPKAATGAETPTTPRTPPNKKVRYEVNYPDGGSKTFWGPPVVEGTTSKSDRHSTFFCETLKMMLPIPTGFTIVEEGGDIDPFDTSDWPE